MKSLKIRILLLTTWAFYAFKKEGQANAMVGPSQITLKIVEKQMTLLLQKIKQMSDIANACSTVQNCTSRIMGTPTQPIFSTFKDCREIYKKGYVQSAVYMITIFHGFYSIPVYCDMETMGAFSGKRGWMVIQRRINGEVSFDRSWNDYLHGFGFPHNEYWIGLRNILKITQQGRVGLYDVGNYILRVDVEDWDGVVGYMEHSSFSLLSEKHDFEIDTLGKYKGTPGLDAPLEFVTSTPFSTTDHNNDERRSAACTRSQNGGWWFNDCTDINLNGVYSNKKELMSKGKSFIRNWRAVNPNYTSLRYISIKLQ